MLTAMFFRGHKAFPICWAKTFFIALYLFWQNLVGLPEKKIKITMS
jgi:hypothetical protein